MSVENKIKNYLDKDYKIKAWPSKIKYRLMVLEYISSKFQVGVMYSEKEVTEILAASFTFADGCFLRRELFDNGFLNRTNDGRKYWKVGPTLMEEVGETSRLIIKDSVTDECESLQRLYESGKYLKDIIGDSFEADHIYKCLANGDLPPITNANKEYYKIKSIYLKETSELIGFIDMYHGYPEEKTLWIGYMYINSSFQRKGFAQEVIEYICNESQKIKLNKISLGVSLKNWQGLRFWSKCGFNTIIGISGDGECTLDSLAFMGLEKKLD